MEMLKEKKERLEPWNLINDLLNAMTGEHLSAVLAARPTYERAPDRSGMTSMAARALLALLSFRPCKNETNLSPSLLSNRAPLQKRDCCQTLTP